jgi:hypothetical protein
MTGQAEGRAPHPAPTESPAAKLDARSHLNAVATIRTNGVTIPARGFFHKAMSGKTRPGVREPGVSHYMCSCCRWSA